MVSCRRPGVSVQGWSQLDRWSKAVSASSRGDAADRVGRHAAAVGHRFRRVAAVQIAFGEQMERRHRVAAVRQRDLADDPRLHAGGAGVDREPCGAVPGQRPALRIAGEQAVVGRARIADHQPGGIGVADQKFEIDAVGAQQFMDQRQHEQPVGAGTDADPFVGDRRVTGPHRIHRDVFRPALFQFARPGLDRVGIVVLGHAEHHQVFRALPVGIAELPEAAADRCKARRPPC